MEDIADRLGVAQRNLLDHGMAKSARAVADAVLIIKNLTAEQDGLKEMAVNWQTAAVAEMERCTAAERERDELRKALQRIANGGTSVLISATLDECPINPDVLEQIVKDAVAATAALPDADGGPQA